MDNGADYKTEKEAFVSGMTGSSVGHVNMVSLAALVYVGLLSDRDRILTLHQASIALHSALRTRLPSQKTMAFSTDFVILATPLLLSVTVFAESPGYLLLLMMIPTSVLLLIPAHEAGTPLPSNHSVPSRHSSRRSSPVRESVPTAGSAIQDTLPEPISAIPPLSALTTYRAHMLLLTAICILAVDFPVFPRRLAKCESFGASLVCLLLSPLRAFLTAVY